MRVLNQDIILFPGRSCVQTVNASAEEAGADAGASMYGLRRKSVVTRMAELYSEGQEEQEEHRSGVSAGSPAAQELSYRIDFFVLSLEINPHQDFPYQAYGQELDPGEYQHGNEDHQRAVHLEDVNSSDKLSHQ